MNRQLFVKKTLAIALALTLCLSLTSALAETVNDTVTATGTATVTLAPDMATFTVGVSTQDVLVTAAQTANASAMQKVIDALKAQGIADEDLQTDNYSISPVYDYTSDSQQILKGYAVSNTVTVTVRALDQLPAMLDAAVAAGANQTYGISFSSSKSADAYDQALATAAKNAVQKASLLASALGRQAGNVLSVTEATDSYSMVTNSKAIAYDSAAGTPIQSGSLSVSASVSVVVQMK